MTEERNYWTRAVRGRVSRRSMLRGTSLAGAGLAGAALIGCGDEDSGNGDPTPDDGNGTDTSPTPTTTPGTDDPFAQVERGGILNTTTTNDPPTIDPYGNLSFLTKGAAAYPYSRLYKVGNDPDVNPWAALPTEDLAESAETEDGQVWTVRLRPGATFHNKSPVDGREVTAEDVEFSFNRLMAEESPGRPQAVSAGWDSIEVVDDQTVRFTLASPRAAFLDNLADTNLLFVMPAEADGGFDPRQDMIGSGPWILEAYEPSQSFTWTANPDYFLEGQPFLDGIQGSIVPEYANRLSQFQAGNTHVDGINPDDVIDLRTNQENVQWRGLQPALLSFIYFSPESQEPDAPWRDERFRHAVSMGQDRAGILDFAYNVSALQDAGLDAATTWNNIVPAGFGERWWLNPQSEAQGEGARWFEYNPDEARKMLQAGGWEGVTFPYRWSANVYGSTFNGIAEAVGNFLLELGLQPETQTEDYSSRYVTNTFVGDFTGIAFGYETPFPEVGGYFPRMFGNDSANHGEIEDEAIRELAEQQAAELDEDQRREYIHEIQRINATHMYYVPNQAGAGTTWTAYRPEVRGIRQTRGYGVGTENYIYFWLDT